MRYFIECSHTSETALNTGIQRVVRNIVNHSQDAAAAGREVMPVVFKNDAMRLWSGPLLPPVTAVDPVPPPPTGAQRRKAVLRNYLRNIYVAVRQLACALLPWPPLERFLMAPRQYWGLTRLLLWPLVLLRRIARPGAPAVVPGAGDVLVLLDASWHLDLWPAIRAAQRRGVLVVCVIYDLIPYTHPKFCVEHLVDAYSRWMKIAMRDADAFLCISRTVADQLHEVVPRVAPTRKRPVHTGYFWLGSELDVPSDAATGLTDEIGGIIAAPGPLYLYVGTIEPRKNHSYALNAFEALWRQGIEANLVIVGRVGWHCEELLARIRGHAQFGRQLFMLNEANDSVLAALYDRANGLVFTSLVEGFGLPMVEALQRGVPVFASDIPVFREIAGAGVSFVDLADPASLQQALAAHIGAGTKRLDAPVRWLSWQESAAQFWDRLDECLAVFGRSSPNSN